MQNGPVPFGVLAFGFFVAPPVAVALAGFLRPGMRWLVAVGLVTAACLAVLAVRSRDTYDIGIVGVVIGAALVCLVQVLFSVVTAMVVGSTYGARRS